MKKGFQRLQVDLADKDVEQLDKTKEARGYSTRSETVRRALVLLGYVTEITKEGYELELVKGKYRARMTPIL